MISKPVTTQQVTGHWSLITSTLEVPLVTIQIDPAAFAYPEAPLPEVWRIRQVLDAPELSDVEGAAREGARALARDPRIRPGASVAIGVGSRGIDNLVLVVRSVVDELRKAGAEPFIVPAMGSHGNAQAEGQISVLYDYGITSESVGAPIRATMEVKHVGALEDGYPVYFDCNAYNSDAVLVINRIKPHTDFSAEIESGLAKMCAIGLGKQKGAATIHRFGAQGLRHIMPKVARKLIAETNIVGGIGLIENQYGRTAELHALTADEIGMDREKSLLNRARQLMPGLPFNQIDVMVVDEMGKDISGAGMDTNVIGRLNMPSIPESEWGGPDVRIVCVLDLTDKSHGNAAGFGLADMTTRRLVERVDFEATMINHRTSGEGGVYRGKLPIVLENAEECVKAAIGSCGRGIPEQVRLARIRNTEVLEQFEVSAALIDEVRANPSLQVISGPQPIDLNGPLPVERH